MSTTQRPPAPRVIAHRATMGHAPENTLAGIRAGLALGVDGIEIDIRATADGEPVLLHDRDLDRTTSGQGPLAKQSLAALRSLDAGGGERVPTLAEALDLTGGRCELIIELKAAEPLDAAALTARVVAEVRARALGPRVWLWSFDAALLEAAAGYDLRIAHLCREPSPATLERARRLGLAGIALHERAASAQRVAGIIEQGFAPFVWTVNDARRIAQMVALPLHGVVSDFPERVQAAIAQRG